MSLESFFGLDTEGSGSAEAREKFQEMMRESAKASKAIAAHQAAQKAQEDKLAKILMRYMKNPAKADIVFLVIKLLQENVPGAFILAVLSLADPDLEKELRESFEREKTEEKSLANFTGEAFVPEEIKLELSAWANAILKAGLMLPGKTLQNVLTPEFKLKSLVLDLLQFALEEFLEHHGIEFSEERLRQVCLVSIQLVLVKLREVTKEKSDIDIIETPAEVPSKVSPL